jgi:hypothetical protein
MKIANKSKINDETLFNEVNDSANYILEQYSGEYRHVRRIGDVVLKVYSKVEEEMDETIIDWSENLHGRISFSERLKILIKYSPLLSNMYFLGKINTLLSHKLINRGDKLHKLLTWLNSERNFFAHYNVFHFELEQSYKFEAKRIKTLNKLKEVMNGIHVLKKTVNEENLNLDSSLHKLA